MSNTISDQDGLVRQIINPETGSSFFVIAQTGNIDIGIRFFLEDNPYRVFFRVRAQPKSGVVIPLNFPEYIKDQLPSIPWFKRKQGYASIVSMVNVIIKSLYSVDDVLQEDDHLGKVYDFLVDKLQPAVPTMSRGDFVSLMLKDLSKYTTTPVEQDSSSNVVPINPSESVFSVSALSDSEPKPTQH